MRLAGHVLRLPEDRPSSVAKNGVPDSGMNKRLATEDLANDYFRGFTRNGYNLDRSKDSQRSTAVKESRRAM